MLWFKSPLGLRFDAKAEQTQWDWLWNFIGKEPKEAVEMLVLLAYEVWLARNKLCFEQKYIEPDLMIANATSILLSYQKANSEAKEKSRENQVHNSSVARWIPLWTDCYKLNVDVAQAGEWRWGVGIVFHNHQEEV